MTLWILPAVIAAIAAVALVAALRIRRRRGNRLQLRVLAGRRRLLGEEIDERLGRLDELPVTELAADRRRAEAVLDLIHAQLLDREAHLQNMADLAGLQRHKIAVLSLRQDDVAGELVDDHLATSEDDVPEDTGILERRDRLEDKLLERIQERSPQPPKRPRRRPRR